MASIPIAGRGNESGRFAQAVTFQDTVRCCEVARANRRTLLAAAIAGRPCQLREAEFGTPGLGIHWTLSVSGTGSGVQDHHCQDAGPGSHRP